MAVLDCRVIFASNISNNKLLSTVTTKPQLKDLYVHFTPQYALKWKVIGTLLGITSEKLDIIEHDNREKAELCCNEMLRWWLRIDLKACWKKLFTVIEAMTNGEAVNKGD